MNEIVTGKERWTGMFCLGVPHGGRDAAAPCSVLMGLLWSMVAAGWVWYGFLLSLASSPGSVSPSHWAYFSCRWRFFLSSVLLLNQRASACCLGLYDLFCRCVVRLIKVFFFPFYYMCVLYFQYLLCHVCLGDLLNICMSCWSFKCSGYGRALCVVLSRAAYILCMRVSRMCILVSVVIPVLEAVVTRCPPRSLFLLYTEAYLSNSQTKFLKETAVHYNANYGYGSILLCWMKDWM